MRKLTLLCLVAVAVVSLVTASAYAHKCTTCPSFKNTKSLAGQNLAKLQGCWRGTSRDGVRSEVSFEMGSDGTALLETQWVDDYPPVYTMYYMDGSGISAHHFCSMGNQVRMKGSAAADGGMLSFRYLDSTNMPSANQPHMTGVVMKFGDSSHITMEWASFCDGGDGDEINSFSYERVTTGCTVGSAKSWSQK